LLQRTHMQTIRLLVTNRVAPCRHLMFYEAVDRDDRRSIGLAVSRDGKADWQRLDRFVVAPARSLFAAARSCTRG